MKRARLTTSQGTISYLESTGRGPTLIFLHGNSSQAAAFDAQMNYFGAHFHCLAVDFLGHGESSAAHQSDAYSFAGCVTQLRDFIGALQLDECVIIGHSLGGHVALDALPHLPQVKGVVLVGAPPFSADTAAQAFKEEPSQGRIFRSELSDEDVEQVCGLFVNKEQVSLAQWLKVSHSVELTQPGVREGILAGLQSGPICDEVALLQQAQIPSLAITGEADPFIHCEYVTDLEQQIAQFQAHTFTGCHHCPHVEDAQQFNRALSAFLERSLNDKVMRISRLNSEDQTLHQQVVARPVVAAGQVLVKVTGCGFSELDQRILAGEYPQLLSQSALVPLSQFIGEVVHVADSQSSLKIGERVFGCLLAESQRLGALADFVLVSEQHVIKAPEKLDDKLLGNLIYPYSKAWLIRQKLKHVQQGRVLLVGRDRLSTTLVADALLEAGYQVSLLVDNKLQKQTLIQSQVAGIETVTTVQLEEDALQGAFTTVIELEPVIDPQLLLPLCCHDGDFFTFHYHREFPTRALYGRGLSLHSLVPINLLMEQLPRCSVQELLADCRRDITRVAAILSNEGTLQVGPLRVGNGDRLSVASGQDFVLFQQVSAQPC
ncbi:alpha/beta fold hydrolase [Pseudoalteromonas sp. R3]|uniref:alpha/beta fold hydrolase n=1 Tax=Pseudoalteromonas sp. R3 TaxID=1709477 RepID=UPI0006B66D70|nr:alpha/beta fold hydrolase [Pseudoalteromonas sp. R3]